MEIPRADKQLLIILETDGCFATGVEVATGCTVGHRTLRVEDIGKVAATFVHAKSERAIRLVPRPDVRERSLEYACHQTRKYFAQLEGYALMPVDELFLYEEVSLTIPAIEIIGRPGTRVNCDYCGEEILNQRETHEGGAILCRSCSGHGYYRAAELPVPLVFGAVTM
jgi:formylmethanofuran dehydrogenase subunit E